MDTNDTATTIKALSPDTLRERPLLPHDFETPHDASEGFRSTQCAVCGLTSDVYPHKTPERIS